MMQAPFITEFAIGDFDQRHPPFSRLINRDRLLHDLLLDMAASFVEQPRPLGANKLKPREMSAHAVVDVAEISEESKIQHSDTLNQLPLDQDRIARQQAIFHMAAAKLAKNIS